MTKQKQILIDTLMHKKTDSVAWVPFAGVHAGKLLGYNATEVLQDADKLFASLMEVNKLYKPNGQPVLFDLQIEAEILGCELVWAVDCPPSVNSHPLQNTTKIPCRCTLPTKEDGRLPMALDVMKRMKEAVGETTALYGLICGPFTLASHLRGNDIFIDMYDDEEYVTGLLDYCADVCTTVAKMYIDEGMDVIAVVDPLVSQVSCDHFEDFLTSPFAKIFDFIRKNNTLSSFFVCGDATRNIENMCKTNPDSISVDENVNLSAAKRITDQYNITIGGNIPLTTVMLHGNQQDNMKCVVDLIDSIDDKTNLIIAPGCDMPYNVPIENGIAVVQAVLNTDATREMIKNYTSSMDDIEVEIPCYDDLTKPFIEVFTLDSASCAACTYMMGAANVAKETFGDKIDVIEYKFTEKVNIARCMKMGVKNLPSIYINGRLAFASIIPNKEELEGKINQAIDELK
ncbi:MAG: uroporphyrinogen decarboxylase family protein [Oscillospiraceae bacterium]